MNEFEQYDILTLSNGKDYTISEITMDEDVKYLMLVEVDKEENVTTNCMYAKVIDENNKKRLKVISDIEELKKMNELFVPMMYEDFI